MLNSRFSFLTLIPNALRETLLLNGPDVRVRLTMIKITSSRLRVVLVPNRDQDVILRALINRPLPYMAVGQKHSVEISETGEVFPRQLPVPVAVVLEEVIGTLREFSRGYARDLHRLPSNNPEQLRQYLKEVLESYFHVGWELGEFDSVRPNVRAFCQHCFQKKLGYASTAFSLERGGGAIGSADTSLDDGKMMSAVGSLIGEEVTLAVLPVPQLQDCRQLMFPQIYTKLFEAGAQTMLDRLYDQTRQEFLQNRLLAHHPVGEG